MRNTLIFLAILLAAIAIFWSLSQNMEPQPTQVSISDVIAMSEQHQIKSIQVEGDKLTVTKKDSTEVIAFKENNANISDLEAVGLNLMGVNFDVKSSSGINWGTILVTLMPVLLIGGLLFFVFRSARGANNQAMRFGRSRARLFSSE